jgi:hypothetical protein
MFDLAIPLRFVVSYRPDPQVRRRWEQMFSRGQVAQAKLAATGRGGCPVGQSPRGV